MYVNVSLKAVIEPQYRSYTLSLSLGKTPITLLISVWDILSDIWVSFKEIPQIVEHRTEKILSILCLIWASGWKTR